MQQMSVSTTSVVVVEEDDGDNNEGSDDVEDASAVRTRQVKRKKKARGAHEKTGVMILHTNTAPASSSAHGHSQPYLL